MIFLLSSSPVIALEAVTQLSIRILDCGLCWYSNIGGVCLVLGLNLPTFNGVLSRFVYVERSKFDVLDLVLLVEMKIRVEYVAVKI